MIGPPLDEAVGALRSEPDRILIRAAGPARRWLAAIRSAPTSGDWLRVSAGLPEVELGALMAPASSEPPLVTSWTESAAVDSDDGHSLERAEATGDPTGAGHRRMAARWPGLERTDAPSVARGAGGPAVAAALGRLAAQMEAPPSHGGTDAPGGPHEAGPEEPRSSRGRPERARTVVPFRPLGPGRAGGSGRALDRSGGGDSLRPIGQRVDQVLEEWTRQEAGGAARPESGRMQPAGRERLSNNRRTGGLLGTPRTRAPAHRRGRPSTPGRGEGRLAISRLLDTSAASWPARGPGVRPFDATIAGPGGLAAPQDEDLALDRVIRLLEKTMGGLGAIEARLSEMAEAARDAASSSNDPGVHWLDEAELAGRLQRILRRQAHRRGIDLS